LTKSKVRRSAGAPDQTTPSCICRKCDTTKFAGYAPCYMLRATSDCACHPRNLKISWVWQRKDCFASQLWRNIEFWSWVPNQI